MCLVPLHAQPQVRSCPCRKAGRMPVYFLRNSNREGRTTERRLSVLQFGSTEREGGMRASERRASGVVVDVVARSLPTSLPPCLPPAPLINHGALFRNLSFIIRPPDMQKARKDQLVVAPACPARPFVPPRPLAHMPPPLSSLLPCHGLRTAVDTFVKVSARLTRVLRRRGASTPCVSRFVIANLRL